MSTATGTIGLFLAVLAANPLLGQAGSAPAASAPATAPESSPASDELGGYVGVIEGLAGPMAVTVAADGRVYVADGGSHSIRVLDADGLPVRTLGQYGAGDGQWIRPSGVAVAADGRLFVSDAGNQRIVVVDGAGRAISAWGAFGRGDGQFNGPRGVAVDAARVYVADELNDRVQVFDHSGAHRLSIGRFGAAPGEFNRPTDVAVDVAGAIYVVDSDNSRVQKFAPDGSFLTQWGDWGAFGVLMSQPLGLTVQDDRVYVADSRNQRVKVFTLEGRFVYEWGLHALRPREGGGKLHYPSDVALSPDGRRAYVCETFEDRCQIHGPAGPEVETARQLQQGLGLQQNVAHYGQRLDANGPLLAIPEPDGQRLLIHDARGAAPFVLQRFGLLGRGPGQLLRPEDVKIDRDGERLWLADSGNRRLQMLTLGRLEAEAKMLPDFARFASAVDLEALSRSIPELAGQTLDVQAIEQDAERNLYLLDARNRLIVVVSPRLEYLRAWGGYGVDEGKLQGPCDLALDAAQARLYVADATAARVSVFGCDGSYQFSFGKRGGGASELDTPGGVAVADDGIVYVTDAARHRVLRFDARGAFVGAWGQRGIGRGEFFHPAGVAAYRRGGEALVCVLDYGNHRAQIFTSAGEFVHAIGPRWFVAPALRGKG